MTTIHFTKYPDIDKYNVTKPIPPFELFLFRYIWLIFAVILYYIQTRRLKFKVINLSVDKDKFKEAAKKTAKELGWKLVRKTDDIIIAKRGFSWRSWGELITIVRDNERILINSICDPDKWPSVLSYGMNKKNRDTYERFVKDGA